MSFTPPEGGPTAEWARAQAERLESDARRMRELAERLDNPGLLPDERAAEVEDVFEGRPKPCTCTLACIPQGISDGQVCRLR